jgi:methionyl-tRNA formyltransferase
MVDGASLRVVFFGTPTFALPTLDALLESPHPVVGVVTQPDRPRGRGQRSSDSPVKARASSASIPVFQPETLKDPAFIEQLARVNADIGVVAAYGRILSQAILAVPRLGMVNVHASLLPLYRGAAPVHRAVMAGERETGVTIMRVVKALDAGPMLASVHRSIDPNETSADVEDDLARLGATLLVSTLDRFARGAVEETPQDDSRATYAHRLTREDAVIHWDWTARRIHDLVRGLHPWPLAHTFVHGARLIVRRSAVIDRPLFSPPGAILAAQGDELHVAAGAGAVALLEIQPEGRRSMTPRDFLAGHRLETSDRFTTAP